MNTICINKAIIPYKGTMYTNKYTHTHKQRNTLSEKKEHNYTHTCTHN